MEFKVSSCDKVNGNLNTNETTNQRNKSHECNDNDIIIDSVGIDFVIEDVDADGDVFEGSSPSSVHNCLAFISLPAKNEFVIDYFGEKVLDRRHTQPMLPWIMAEMKRFESRQHVTLEIQSHTLRAKKFHSKVVIFEHKLQTLCRFARSHQDPKCFAYQKRISVEQPFTCHVFTADNEQMVPQLFAMIRDATRESLKECNDAPDLSADLFTGSHVMMTRLFEVLYLGKVVVSSKKTPPTFIDDVVSQFQDHETSAKSRYRHASGASVRSLPASLDGSIFPADTLDEPDVFTGHSLTVASTQRRKSVGGSDVDREDRANRTRLIHVGETDLCLISPDRKSVILRRKFKDISFCSQGIKHRDHFGFISRDVTSNNFFCYVFMCANDSVVEEVMQTLKQAFQVAFQHSNKKHVVCELCPMHQFHDLCLAIDKSSAQVANEVIQKRIAQLRETEQQEVINKLWASQSESLEDTNTVLMGALLSMCESRQKEHSHISEQGGPPSKNDLNLMECTKNKSSKFDSLKIRAKKSLTNSFENLIRGRSRKEEVQEANKKLTIDSNNSTPLETPPHTTPQTTPENTPLTSPTQHMPFHLPPLVLTVTPPPEEAVSPSGRPRSNTDPSIMFSSHFDDSLQAHAGLGSEDCDQVEKSLPVTTRQARMLIRSPSSPVNFTCEHHLAPPQKSWRLQMLSRVVSPKCNTPHKCILASPRKEGPSGLREGRKLSRQRVHELWKKAILETLLMIRMQRNTLKAVHDAKSEKLHYVEITPCVRTACNVWDDLLSTPNRSSVLLPTDTIRAAVEKGVPRSRRGDVWLMLMEQHRLRHTELEGNEDDVSKTTTSYRDLLKQLTSYQHAILIDLGRTFPNHPYFSSQLGAGQLSLFNLLKAYSLRDPQVGYCQGLSFIAGVLLMHMDEEDAFETLTYLMFQLGLRRQFCPDMVVLQIQLYQLSRLLHDKHRDLCRHLEAHDISATLYSAAWFLTLFASQFPLGFVSRVFDLIFLQGIEVVFKVALVLLGTHRESIMTRDSMESIVSFLKTTLPEMSIVQMEHIINQVVHMDISRQLHAYEVEYHVLQEEMMSPINDHCCPQMEALQQQNAALTDQLASATANQKALEVEVAELKATANRLRVKVQSLEQERSVLLATMTLLRESCDKHQESGIADGKVKGCGDGET